MLETFYIFYMIMTLSIFLTQSIYKFAEPLILYNNGIKDLQSKIFNLLPFF